MASQTICLENQAKRTLAFFSELEDNPEDWEWQRGNNSIYKRSHLGFLKPIKNIKQPKTDSKRNNVSQLSHRRRTTLIPSKVSVQNQKQRSQKKISKILQGNSVTKQNFRPHRTIRNSYTLSKQAQQIEIEKGIDFMQYWIKHRFQEGSVNTLVERLRSNVRDGKNLRL